MLGFDGDSPKVGCPDVILTRRMTAVGRIEPDAQMRTGHPSCEIARRQLSNSLLALMAAPDAGLKVDFMAITVRTRADGDRLLTLPSCR